MPAASDSIRNPIDMQVPSTRGLPPRCSGSATIQVTISYLLSTSNPILLLDEGLEIGPAVIGVDTTGGRVRLRELASGWRSFWRVGGGRCPRPGEIGPAGRPRLMGPHVPSWRCATGSHAKNGRGPSAS